MRHIIIAALVVVVGCAADVTTPSSPDVSIGGDSDKKKPRPPSNPPPSSYQPFSGAVPLTNWTVTDEAVRFITLSTAAFDFPRDPQSRNYLFKDVAYALTESQTYTLRFSVTGSAPVFTFGVQNPICTMPPMVTPFLWHGDSLGTITDRYWAFAFKQTLALGNYSVSVPLTSQHWFDVYGAQSAQQFAAARSRVNHLGMTFGGGCYYGHGVGLTSGSARFAVTSLELRP